MNRLLRVLLVLTLLCTSVAVAPPAALAEGGFVLDAAPGHDTVTGVIEIRVEVAPGVERYAITAQMGRPGDYPTEQTLVSATVRDQGLSLKYQWESWHHTDGYWTLRLQTWNKGDTKPTERAVRVLTVDNRWGFSDTEPGNARGTIRVTPKATGTVAVDVTVDGNAVDWTLYKQSATDTGTNRWSRLYGSGLRHDVYHWYTRSDQSGGYTLRLEIRDSIKHRQYTTVTVTVDNRLLLPQTEPGKGQAALSPPAIVSGILPIDLNFTGPVTAWRLQDLTLGSTSGSPSSVASGQGTAVQTVPWDTTRASDGSHLLILEVEDANKHIWQTTAQTTVANKVTSTLKGTISAGEEHRYIISVTGGLTAFRLSSNPTGYYRVGVYSEKGTLQGDARMSPAAQSLQMDLPGGKYVLSVKALFVQAASDYGVEMKGATAYTIPLIKLTTNLPLGMRGATSVPMLMSTQSARPSAADWWVDGGDPTAITNPDGTVAIDTAPLKEGLHSVTFRAINPVGFTGLSSFPFVVDNRASFSDVPDTHPARWAVELLYDLNIAKGYPNGTFNPGGSVTRAELAKMLAVATGLDVSQHYSGVFADVKEGDWFAPYVEAVYQAGTVKGSAGPGGALLYRPGDPVSRGELMVMVLRAIDVPDVLAGAAGKSLSNPDWRSVAEWAKASMYLGMKFDLLSDREGGRVDADKAANRGEVAIALGKLKLNMAN